MRTGPIVIALLCLIACHRNDTADAPRLAGILAAAQPSLTAVNRAEQDLIDRVRAWCNSILDAGSGHDAALDRNAASAAELSRASAAVAQQLDGIRQSLNGVHLRAEQPRRVRADLAAQLTRRHTALLNLHTALDDAAAQLRAAAQDRSYTGDTVPSSIRKIDASLGRWPPAEDIFSPALATMRSQ